MWLVKNAVWIVVAIRILVSDSSSLTHRAVWIDSEAVVGTCWHRAWLLGIWALASDQQNSFMEATDNWDFWLALGLLLILALGSWGVGIWLLGLGWLLQRVALRVGRLAFILTLVGSAALRWLHLPLPRLLLWLVFALGRGSLSLLLGAQVLRSTARSLFEEYLLILLSHWCGLIRGHHTIVDWHVA